jgi:YD repeat-containing protein
MTTPYGTTNFAYDAPGAACAPGLGPCRYVQVTDPLGGSEREEWIEPAPIAASDPSNTVPQGMPLTIINNYLQFRDSFHWDKNAYAAAGCGTGPPPAGCSYDDARDRRFAHDGANFSLKSTSLESVKYALENRIWFEYPGQRNSIVSGSYQRPSAAGRVLDDGTTQLRQFAYDTANYFEPTQAIDPVGRTTSFGYAPNAIDPTLIAQTVAGETQATLARFTYSGANCTVPHRVCSDTDAAGQTTTYTYNPAGQLTAITNPLNQTTSFAYDAAGDLKTIVNADNQTAASFSYDAFGRVRTYTDAAGWTVTCDYDAADRIARITYPDGTAQRYTWDRLDLAAYQTGSAGCGAMRTTPIGG